MSHYVLRNGTYPDDAVSVDAERGLFFPLGGGFARKLTENFDRHFRKVTADDEKLTYRQEQFTCDDDHTYYPGYTLGYLWNGWQMPSFSKETAFQILGDISRACGDEFEWVYDDQDDRFLYKFATEEDHTIEGGRDITFAGNTIHVYSIGSGCWTWDAADL